MEACIFFFGLFMIKGIFTKFRKYNTENFRISENIVETLNQMSNKINPNLEINFGNPPYQPNVMQKYKSTR